MASAHSHARDEFTVLIAHVLDHSENRSTTQAANKVFELITGIDPVQLSDILLRGAPIPVGASALATRDRLAHMLNVRKADASELLGSSDSRFSRNDTVDRDILDRTLAIVEAYVRVAAALGPKNAAAWLNTPHPALDGQVPTQLLETSLGRKLVDDLVDALLAGAYI